LLQDAESKQRGVTAKEKSLQADLQVLDVHLDFHQLRAPIAGVLGALQAVPGQTLAVGAVVADVTDLSEIEVAAFVPPHAARKLRVGQTAHFTDSASGPQGKIAFIAAQAQPDTGNLLVKLRFPNQELGLRANQVTRIEVLTQPERKRLTIRESVIMEDQDPPVVVVATEIENKGDKGERTGKARRLQVRLGVRDRKQGVVEILALEDPANKQSVPVADAWFVIEGGHGLHDGDPLKLEAPKEH
jgi:multidrug efflux pump subunit AcrA (membrane-fusion protein)